MEIISGIHQVDGVNANPYFIREETTAGRRWERSASDRMETIGASRWSDIVGEELVLVDAGMSKNPSKILTYLTGTLARRPSELKTIIITHAHPDHTGGLAAMVRATGAKVAIHEQDAPLPLR